MDTNRILALVLSGLVGLAACSTEPATEASDTATEEAAGAADETTDALQTADDEATDGTQETVDEAADTAEVDALPSAGGPGQSVSPESVATVDELVALIQEAYGDASLGLHRGHQPVESTLIDFLGITHDEMHVRMETQGQNLAAVATDLGLDPQGLIDELVASWSPAIYTLLTDGTIAQDEADSYLAALTEAFTYRVTWNGRDATPTFSAL
jgi:hypothetical protein